MWKTISAAGLCSCLALLAMPQRTYAQVNPAVVGAFTVPGGPTCPAAGTGGDPILDAQKNRGGTPPTQYTHTSVAELFQRFPTLSRSVPSDRAHWSAQQRADIQRIESENVYVIGYVVKALAEAKESSNCQLVNPDYHDVHLYFVDQANQAASDSAIVEVTPRWRYVNPTWNAKVLDNLAGQGALVRISGHLLYDQKHWAMIDAHQRRTLWELHPITAIDVNTDRGWMPLAEYVRVVTAAPHARSVHNVTPTTWPAVPKLRYARTAAQTAAARNGSEDLP